jgi:hypothetical protein
MILTARNLHKINLPLREMDTSLLFRHAGLLEPSATGALRKAIGTHYHKVEACHFWGASEVHGAESKM